MCDSKDNEKTLTEELQVLRSRVAELQQIETEHKKAEEKLKQYEFIVESASDAVFFKDLKSRYIIANRKTLEAFGLSHQQVIGKNDYEIMPDKQEAKKNIEDDRFVFKTGKTNEIVKLMTGADGKQRWFQAIKVPEFDDKGNIIGIVGIARDITGYKKTEETLRESQRLQKAMLDTIPDMAWLKDKQSRFIAANERFGKACGIARADDLVGKTDLDIWPKDLAQRYRADDREVMETGRRKCVVEPLEETDGTRRWMETFKTPIYDDNGQVIGTSGIARDITDRLQAEKALQKARDELEIRVEQRTADLARANKQLRSLASELSLAEERLRRRMAIDVHDHIGQNLAISKIKIESLVESASSPEVAETLAELRDLIGETIVSTRSLTFELSPPVLYELGFEAAVKWLVRQIRQQHGLLAEFRGDGRRKPLDDDVKVLLFQAVRELLVNVAKHAHAHKVNVVSQRVGDEIRVSVEDDGVGFDVSQTHSRSYTMGGFGLFSIRERLNHMCGYLDIDSVPGHGTRVTLVAPMDHKSEKK